MHYSVRTAVLPLTLALFGLAWAQDGPDSVMRGTKQFRKKVLTSGLAGPWEVTWGPDNKLWVTERTGKRILRIDPESGERSVAITIDEVFAPGGQDGLLGMALHPELLQGTGNDFVYAAYTYVDKDKGPDPTVADPASPYRYFYAKVVRLSYNRANGTLSNAVNLITGLPAGNDHVGGRLKIGPDRKLYLTLGDQGNNQLGNFCLPAESQRLPTRKELDSRDYVAYVGKSLRLNLDGSVPADNAQLAGVVSHVNTYGHRNPQGLDFGPDGTLYSTEHGPKTDDEINILKRGSNYGWPNVAGMKDDKAYAYARWAEASTPCSQLKFSDLAIHPSVPRTPESKFRTKFVEPIATMFTVPTGYNFEDPVCKGVNFICYPTVGASSVEHYQSKGAGVPGWDRVLFVTTLKRGSLYVAPLAGNGQTVNGRMWRYFQSVNRFRDTAVSPDGKTIYIATDPDGLVEATDGGVSSKMQDPGAILAFTYEREGTAADAVRVSEAKQPVGGATPVTAVGSTAPGLAPQFTAEQAAAGKTSYNASCAVCHGSTMTNGTFGTPLAGEYFKRTWSGKTMEAFFAKSKTMPPASPGSLPGATYANIIAYILDMNGYKGGDAKLPLDGAKLGEMTIR